MRSNKGLIGVLSNSVDFSSFLETNDTLRVGDLRSTIPIRDETQTSCSCGLNCLGIPSGTSSSDSKRTRVAVVNRVGGVSV
jgi:hypothetical protein